MNYFNDVTMATEHRGDLLRESEIDRLALAAAEERPGLGALIRQWFGTVRCHLACFWYQQRRQTLPASRTSACS